MSVMVHKCFVVRCLGATQSRRVNCAQVLKRMYPPGREKTRSVLGKTVTNEKAAATDGV